MLCSVNIRTKRYLRALARWQEVAEVMGCAIMALITKHYRRNEFKPSTVKFIAKPENVMVINLIKHTNNKRPVNLRLT